MQDQPLKTFWKRVLRSLPPDLTNIRGRIIAPYLILTFLVAVIGLYVIISLVTIELDERLDNYLLESGRSVLNGLARQEDGHIKSLQLVMSVGGVPEAVEARDVQALIDFAGPVVTTADVDALIIIDKTGEPVLSLLQRDRNLESIAPNFESKDVQIAQALLDGKNPNALPKRGIGIHPGDGRFYYFTAISINLEGEFAGVMMMGTALDGLVTELKLTSLAEIIVYLDGGKVIASTFAFGLPSEDQRVMMEEQAISAEVFKTSSQVALSQTGIENIVVDGLDYNVARGPMMVSSDVIAVFGVALPADLVSDTRISSRNTYAGIFLVAMAAVIFIGYSVAQRITQPLNRLVQTSQAIADGDLEQRSGIESTDEIGALASTFDTMTGRLQERTGELQDSLQIQRETASRMQSILSSIGDAVLFENIQGEIIKLNGAAEVMLDEMSANFLSGPMREIPVPDQEAGTDTSVTPWLLERRRFQVADHVYTGHSARVVTDNGENLGTVIVLRDVTAEVEAEQLKDAFVAHVSHELRTPLTAIKGYTALLQATTAPVLERTQYEFLNRIGRQTDNLVSMINALLDFSEVEASGRLGLRLEPLELAPLLEEIYDEWQDKMTDKSLTFTLEMPEEFPLVNADSNRLRWALINLVRNAHQYTESGGVVVMRLSSSDDYVSVDVIDTGAGISPADQRRLFSRFFRVMQGHDDTVRGLGLGLYVSKAIAEAHNGYISVTSEMGRGSTFSLILPAIRELVSETIPA